MNFWDILSYQNACDNPIFFIHLIVKSHKKERLHFARVKKKCKKGLATYKDYDAHRKVWLFKNSKRASFLNVCYQGEDWTHFSMKHFSRKSSFFIMVNSLELWWNSIVVEYVEGANLLASFEMTSGKK